MNDEELRAFMRPRTDRDLSRLEAEVWAGVSAQAADRKLGAMMMACQSGVMVLALSGSLAAGTTAVAVEQHRHGRLALLNGEDLAPSTLLIGR